MTADQAGRQQSAPWDDLFSADPPPAAQPPDDPRTAPPGGPAPQPPPGWPAHLPPPGHQGPWGAPGRQGPQTGGQRPPTGPQAPYATPYGQQPPAAPSWGDPAGQPPHAAPPRPLPDGGPAALPPAGPGSGPQRPYGWPGPPVDAPSGGQRPPTGPQPPYPGGQQPPWPGQSPTGGQHPLQGRVIPPGASGPQVPPGGPRHPEPGPPNPYPGAGPDDGATQFIPPVTDDGATQTIPPVRDEPPPSRPADDVFGGRPMFRDEAPPRDTGSTTAQFDMSGFTADPGGDARGGRPRGGGSGTGRRGGPSPKILIGAGFGALVLLGGIGAFVLATQGSSGPGEYEVSQVADESVDPDPLQVDDVFGAESIEVDGQTFTRVQTDDTERCETVTHGDYGQVLVDNECRQVVRASYVNEDRTRAVTVGVAAMADQDGAQAAQEGQDLASSQWFAGLAGQNGSGAERMDVAGGHGSGATWGRYVVFALAANADGRTPGGDAADLAELSGQFVNLPLVPLGDRAA
ncbi:hypothetical protein [Marinactinospora rubrisoli]|uniref:Uncharacterized protein n=1 Tax=Marinactinospora rubrisoli TaxID=2715399 RepID=A0ABW2KJA8_9ACTN